MGAQASTNKTSTTNDLVTQAYNSCPNVSTSNSLVLKNVTHSPDPVLCAGKDTGFSLNQTAAVDANCVITSLQQNAADAISKLDATAQGGLGFTASTNINDINTQITNQLNNQCGSLSASNTINGENLTVTACNFSAVQNASLKSMCQINALQKTATAATTTSASTATGLTLASFLTGYSPYIAIAIVAAVVIILGIWLYFKFGKKKSDSNEDESSDIDYTDSNQQVDLSSNDDVYNQPISSDNMYNEPDNSLTDLSNSDITNSEQDDPQRGGKFAIGKYVLIMKRFFGSHFYYILLLAIVVFLLFSYFNKYNKNKNSVTNCYNSLDNKYKYPLPYNNEENKYSYLN